MNYTKYFYQSIMDAMQNLEEIGGPDTTEQYLAVLTMVRLEIDKRIDAATNSLLLGGE